MLTKTYTDTNDNTALYMERWETIYAGKNFDEKYLQSIKEELIKDGYKVVHVVTGKQKEEEKPKEKKKRGRQKKNV